MLMPGLASGFINNWVLPFPPGRVYRYNLAMNIIIRRAEPADAEGLWKCFITPLVVRNTLQTPYRSVESVREQLAKCGENEHSLLAIVDGEVV